MWFVYLNGFSMIFGWFCTGQSTEPPGFTVDPRIATARQPRKKVEDQSEQPLGGTRSGGVNPVRHGYVLS